MKGWGFVLVLMQLGFLYISTVSSQNHWFRKPELNPKAFETMKALVNWMESNRIDRAEVGNSEPDSLMKRFIRQNRFHQLYRNLVGKKEIDNLEAYLEEQGMQRMEIEEEAIRIFEHLERDRDLTLKDLMVVEDGTRQCLQLRMDGNKGQSIRAIYEAMVEFRIQFPGWRLEQLSLATGDFGDEVKFESKWERR